MSLCPVYSINEHPGLTVPGVAPRLRLRILRVAPERVTANMTVPNGSAGRAGDCRDERIACEHMTVQIPTVEPTS